MVKVTSASIHSCAYILLIIGAVITVAALKKASNINEYNMVKNYRTRLRRNYVVQKTNNDASDYIDDYGVSYPVEALDPDTSPEELPALTVDFANMIRNDIILLDNSVQTTTRKRGNRIQEVPCSCDDGKGLLFLGENYIPKALEMRHCNESACPGPYICKARSHNVRLLKKKEKLNELSKDELPADLKRWVTVNQLVTVGCVCSLPT